MAVVALLLGWTGPLFPQSGPPVEAGSRIRLRTSEAGSRIRLRTSMWFPHLPRDLRGTVEAVRGDTILIRSVGDTLVKWVWAPEAPTELFVHRGRKSSWGRGLAYGTLLGAAIGAGLGLASGDDASGWFSWTAEEKAVVGGAGLGLIGALIGVVAGGLSHHDVWVPGAAQPKVRPVIGLDGRAGVTVSLRF